MTPRLPVHAIEAVVALAREVVGQGALVFRQNIDSKVGCRSAKVMNGGDRVAEADEDQRAEPSDTDVKATHGEPVGRAPASRTLAMVTPVAKRPQACRNSSLVTDAERPADHLA